MIYVIECLIVWFALMLIAYPTVYSLTARPKRKKKKNEKRKHGHVDKYFYR